MPTGLKPGNYRIANGLLGPGSSALYLTFPGPNMNLILNPSAAGNTQVWTVTGIAGGKQTISPFTTGFQANGAAAGNFIRAKINPCRWNINFDPVRGLYTIQASGAALVWDLAGPPTDGQFVALHVAGATRKLTQYWRFVSA